MDRHKLVAIDGDYQPTERGELNKTLIVSCETTLDSQELPRRPM